MFINEFIHIVDGNEYEIRCTTHGDPTRFLTTSYSFEVKVNSEYVPLKTEANNELVRDLCCVMGLDPVKELRNIVLEELRNELKCMHVRSHDD